MMMDEATLEKVQLVFGDRLASNVPLAQFTSARVGGAADGFIQVDSATELAETISRLWQLDASFVVLGSGSNVLVNDGGVRGIVVYNRVKAGSGIRFLQTDEQTSVRAESGVSFGTLARQAALRGLAGLEWAGGIPGTVGGAVVGNAGAHGGEVAENLVMAEILQWKQINQDADRHPVSTMAAVKANWSVNQLDYSYRNSIIKRLNASVSHIHNEEPGNPAVRRFQSPRTIVLAATFRLQPAPIEQVRSRLDEYLAYRRRTQPPGASMGSMFKNPSGDNAGRLIEAVGLKGTRLGGVEISPLHANFFVNLGDATAAEIYRLIELARRTVAERFGIMLELEIELLGDWQAETNRLPETAEKPTNL
jgi:UDP-N-acetylmuramate dehydrogenase